MFYLFLCILFSELWRQRTIIINNGGGIGGSYVARSVVARTTAVARSARRAGIAIPSSLRRETASSNNSTQRSCPIATIHVSYASAISWDAGATCQRTRSSIKTAVVKHVSIEQ